MRVTRLLSISHIVQFLGWKEKREAVFINIPTIPFPLSVNLCGKKEKKKFPCLSSMCHNHSLSRKNIKRILSSQQPFQFFGLLSNFKKKVKKNFLNFKGFFPNGIFGSNLWVLFLPEQSVDVHVLLQCLPRLHWSVLSMVRHWIKSVNQCKKARLWLWFVRLREANHYLGWPGKGTKLSLMMWWRKWTHKIGWSEITLRCPICTEKIMMKSCPVWLPIPI